VSSWHATELFQLLTKQPAVLVTVDQVQGSVPRGKGAWMAVFASQVVNTIGGGQLEHQAIETARLQLQNSVQPQNSKIIRYPLGPSLGQCCGGVVHLKYESIEAANTEELQIRLAEKQSSVALFGGGHVGKALIKVLINLPFQVRWIDSRDEIFPEDLPLQVSCEFSDPVQAAVKDLSAASSVLIMSFSHAEDLDIVAACLKRQREQSDLAFIGLIGSATKWASFQSRLIQKGFTRKELDFVTCPIGLPGITGKEPEVIALSVAAQLLMQSSAMRR
jgi:xanthine dehydrogenase accessory factor